MISTLAVAAPSHVVVDNLAHGADTVAIATLIVAAATLIAVGWQIYIAIRTLEATKNELILTQRALELAKDEFELANKQLAESQKASELTRQALESSQEQNRLTKLDQVQRDRSFAPIKWVTPRGIRTAAISGKQRRRGDFDSNVMQ